MVVAGTYLFRLVSNHGFLDGNKRVGMAAALVFLRLNGFGTNFQAEVHTIETRKPRSHMGSRGFSNSVTVNAYSAATPTRLRALA
jgi:prophage maintenance system killer protein